MWEIALLFSALFLAYVNGANDNFKGVATLYGSKTTGYKPALLLATLSTLLGSAAALMVAGKLLSAFTGKGLVPHELIQEPSFALAVGLGAAGTIFLATQLGFPISTTHALIGALTGVGFASGSLNVERLGSTFLLPLLLSPLLALGAAIVVFPLLRRAKRRLVGSGEICLCVGRRSMSLISGDRLKATALAPQAHLEVGDGARCEREFATPLLRIRTELVTTAVHYLSSSLVCFARGLNDTPKIAAILLMAGATSAGPTTAITGVALAIALGGLLSARKVAEKMSKEITSLDSGQGMSANLVTSLLVLGASHIGVPVSTTHVSCGSLFGIGWVSGGGRWKTIAAIGASWLITLPTAMLLSVLVYLTAWSL